MLGYFKVVNNKNEELGRYKYSSITNQQKRKLRLLKDVTLYCCCGSEDIEMKISSDLKIYPATQNAGQQHEHGCPKFIYKKKEDLWHIRLTASSIYYHVAASFATANDYALKINQITYDRLVHPEYRLPDNFTEFNNKVLTTLKYIETPGGDILYNISVNKKNVATMPPQKEYFVYGLLAGKPVIKQYGNKKLLFIDVYDISGYKRRYYANKEAYKEETSKIFNGCENIIVCGFAYKKTKDAKILTLSDFCVKAIDEYGIIISV